MTTLYTGSKCTLITNVSYLYVSKKTMYTAQDEATALA